MAPTPVLLPGESQGRRSLVGCRPWGRTESDTTERLHLHFSLSCTGEGNGTHPSALAWRIPGMGQPGGLPENPRDGGAWWAAVCGVARSRTRLKRLSSSSRDVPVLLLQGQFCDKSAMVPALLSPPP